MRLKNEPVFNRHSSKKLGSFPTQTPFLCLWCWVGVRWFEVEIQKKSFQRCKNEKPKHWRYLRHRMASLTLDFK